MELPGVPLLPEGDLILMGLEGEGIGLEVGLTRLGAEEEDDEDSGAAG